MNLFWATNIVRKFLFIISLSVAITSLLLMSVGIIVKIGFEDYHLSDNSEGYSAPSSMLIYVGYVFFPTAAVGCIAAHKKIPIFTFGLSGYLSYLLIVDLIFGFYGDLVKMATESILCGNMQKTMQQYGEDLETTIMWDKIQGNFQCCGVYSYYEWTNATNASHDHLPTSCCYIPPDAHANFTCSVHSPTVYAEGCRTKLVDYIKGYSDTIATARTPLVVAQLLSLIFYWYMWYIGVEPEWKYFCTT